MEWINVNDSLPECNIKTDTSKKVSKEVLVWCHATQKRRLGYCERNISGYYHWYPTDGLGIPFNPLFWQPLSLPPEKITT